MLRALESKNYRLFFTGQIVSLVGNWMTSSATGWLVYRVTGSEQLLGVVGFASQFPTFLGSPFAGVLVDRMPLRATLVVTQTMAMFQSFALAFVVLSGWFDGPAQIHWLIGLAAVQGLINAVDITARQAFVVQLINKREDLPNAIALNSSIVNAARVLGPAAAAALILLVNEGVCFLIDGISYSAVIVALLAIRVAPYVKPARRLAVFASLKEGFVASFGFPPIRAVLALLALVSICGVPYMVLMPIFAKEILHGGAGLYGALSASAGAGALGGAIYLASRRSVLGIGRVLAFAAGAFGLAIIAFSFSTVGWVSLLLMPIAGASMIVQMAGSNTLLQTLADDDKRGRVMAMFAMCFMGTVPIGALLAGWLAGRIGAPSTVFFGGLACVAGAAIFYFMLPGLRVHTRPIYVQRGILPSVADGIKEATIATERAAG